MVRQRYVGFARRVNNNLIVRCNDEQIFLRIKVQDSILIDDIEMLISDIKDDEIILTLSPNLLRKKYYRKLLDDTLVSIGFPILTTETEIDPYEEILNRFKQGHPLIIVTESKKYLIMLAEFITETILKEFHNYGRVHIGLTYYQALKLGLPLVQTADHRYHTISCGISSSSDQIITEEISTIKALIRSTPSEFIHPGYIVPIISSRYGPIKEIYDLSTTLAKMVNRVPCIIVVTLHSMLEEFDSINFEDLNFNNMNFNKISRPINIKEIKIDTFGTWELLQFSDDQIMIHGSIYKTDSVLVYFHIGCSCLEAMDVIDEKGELNQCTCKKKYSGALNMIKEKGSGLVIFVKKASINYDQITNILHHLEITKIDVINGNPDILPEFLNSVIPLK